MKKSPCLVFLGLWLTSFACFILLPLTAMASNKQNFDQEIRQARDWNSFEAAMEEAHQRDRVTGISSIISGSLVALGGFAGAEKAEDSGSRFVFGLSQSLGIAGIGYGIAKISFGNDYNSFYQAAQGAGLSARQKDVLVRRFLEEEHEKREIIRKTQLFTHVVIGAMNLYSSTRESDTVAKNFFQLLAGINFALAISYGF